MDPEDIFSNIHFDLDNNKIIFDDFFADNTNKTDHIKTIDPQE